MKQLFLFASITIASGLLLTNIYNSLVDAKSWGAHIPQSIETAKEYFKTVNPGNFYRIFSPANQVLALLVVILFWKTEARWYLVTALLIYVAADALTFAYFYPRNEIIMSTRPSDMNTLKKAWEEWTNMNWVRSAVVLSGVIFSFISLHKIYIAAK